MMDLEIIVFSKPSTNLTKLILKQTDQPDRVSHVQTDLIHSLKILIIY